VCLEPSWVVGFILINQLYQERLLFLGRQVDDEIANQLIGIMMYLNGEDESNDMFLYINSPGASVTDHEWKKHIFTSV